MKRIFLFLILIAFCLNIAAADTDVYNFDVVSGPNQLDLNSTYNGSFVNSIEGLFYPATESPLHRIPISITSHTGLDNATIKLEIPYNPYMSEDFSDLRFSYLNGTSIPYYISEKNNNSNATVYLKLDILTSQTIYMNFDIDGASSESEIGGIFLYHLINSTGYNTTSNQTMYTGSFTTVEINTTLTGGSTSTYHAIFLNNSYMPYLSKSTSMIIQSAGGNSPAIDANPPNIANIYASTIDDLILVSNGSSSVQTTASVDAFENLSFYKSGVTTNGIYNIFIYNSTNFSYSFGSIEELLPPDEVDISIDFSSTAFSSVNFTAASPGNLEFSINYNPHNILITADNESFISGNATLRFITHPEELMTTYQIALDDNFYSLVLSGPSYGSINASALQDGAYYWRIRQTDNTWSEARSFIISPAPDIEGFLNFRIINELNDTNVSATVKLTNSTTTLTKTGSNITFNSSEVIAGNYSVQITATNYTTRFYDVVSPGNYTMYVLPNANASVVYFSIIDNTNTFQFDSTKLEIIKQTPNGSLVVHNSYFDATGFSIATLNNFDSYILKVVSDSGHEKILGNYIQAGQNTVQLVISDIILKENNSSLYGGFTYNLTKSGSAIKFDWINPNNALIEPLLFQIYKNDDIVMNISSDAPFGSINYQDNVDGEMKLDPTATYRIVLTAKTVNGTIRVNEFYKVGGESVSIDFEKIPLALRIVISLILLILVASLFNITNAKFSAIVVTLVAGFLTLIGFLPILPSVLIWLLFVAIVAYKTNNR